MTELLSAVIQKVTADFAPFLVAGLPIMLVGMVIGIVGVFVAYGAAFAGMVPGIAANDEGLVVLGMMVGLFGGLFLVIGAAVLVAAPMTASLHRAVWNYIQTGEKLTFGSAFSTMGQDVVRVVLFQLVVVLLVSIGAMFCYLPGIVVAAALQFAGPAIYVHRMSIGPAISRSVAHLQAHPGWHLGVFGLSFVMSMVLAYVPLIGPAMLATLHPLFVLLCYKVAFGDEEPASA